MSNNTSKVILNDLQDASNTSTKRSTNRSTNRLTNRSTNRSTGRSNDTPNNISTGISQNNQKEDTDENTESKKCTDDKFVVWVYENGDGLIKIYKEQIKNFPELEFGKFCKEIYSFVLQPKEQQVFHKKSFQVKATNINKCLKKYEDEIGEKYYDQWYDHYEYYIKEMYRNYICDFDIKISYEDFVYMAYICSEKYVDPVTKLYKPVLI